MFSGRSLNIPWAAPILGAEGNLGFDGRKPPKDMNTVQLRYALNGPGPCDQMAVLSAKKEE